MRRLLLALMLAGTSTALLAQAPSQPDWAAIEAETLKHFQALLRFDTSDPFQNSGYSSPGWRRAQANATEDTAKNWGTRSGYKSTYTGGPRTIEGELVAKSVVGAAESTFSTGERIFHLKFGYGKIASIDGNKLTIEFEKAGVKRVLDSFVERH